MSTTDPGKDIREQAARLADLSVGPEGLTPADRDELQAFVQDPQQEQEFRIQVRMMQLAADLPEADRLRKWADTHNEARAHSRQRVYRWSALAASIVLAVTGYFAFTLHWFDESTYVTQTNQTRVVTFPEDSIAILNTQTEVRWIGSKDDRRVELAKGEALFEVVHDKTRPFRVMLDNSEIRVLGTRFNVYRKASGDITVTVLEGLVEVSGYGDGTTPAWVRKVRANEEFKYRAIGLVGNPYPTQAQSAVNWRSGQYVFNDKPIAEVLEELTRYTDQRIVIRDDRIAQKRISGGIPPREVRRALAMLKDLALIEVKESNGTFFIDAKPEERKD